MNQFKENFWFNYTGTYTFNNRKFKIKHTCPARDTVSKKDCSHLEASHVSAAANCRESELERKISNVCGLPRCILLQPLQWGALEKKEINITNVKVN